MPEAGPLGEVFLEAKLRAIVSAFCVKRPWGGCVESVLTFATHRFLLDFNFATAFLENKTEMRVSQNWRLSFDKAFQHSVTVVTRCNRNREGLKV